MDPLTVNRAANLPRSLRAYLDCALWAEIDDDGEPLDRGYQTSDFAPEAIEAARADLAGFEDANVDDLAGLDPEMIGHTFWLNRNGHGTGFWDRGLGERGERLSKASKVYGESNAYVGDDGRVYLS